MRRRDFFTALAAALLWLIGGLPRPRKRWWTVLYPQWFRRTYELETTTLHIKRESHMVEFFSYCGPAELATVTAALDEFGQQAARLDAFLSRLETQA